ncbi:MAG: EscU/YscU/HrcU family type III secretion system export apparatus switch protein [Desulfobulbus sp.]|jgi:flagellar biosynthesis protein|uniref:EscU/YscU/HrcU family type III secretion system export apparatus switch protein n=1 Tax=Desulfobulbus sp. TaxID=895 RepID=UPI00284110F6|nr:EscU/YscU/HrcU family type III secretion system export apparatus switch protein [Desulfobulbus sp.]MDR2550728.1 EscU/YscU/HrcU family type III secretion system export apparatus switch protein [Desulfobulbus sp.]
MAEEQGKRKRAVALLYDPKRGTAPTVVASGANLIAEKIIAAAAAAGVHIKEDPDLVELLAKIPVGAEIPAELYQTIAEVLAFVYAVNNRYKSSKGTERPQ